MEQNQNISIRRRKDRLLSFSQVSIGGCSLLILLLIALLCPTIGKDEVFAEEGDTPASQASAKTTVNSTVSLPSKITLNLDNTAPVSFVPTDPDGTKVQYNVHATVEIENSAWYTVTVGSNDNNTSLKPTSPTNTREVSSIAGYETLATMPINTWGFAYGTEEKPLSNDPTYEAIPTSLHTKEVAYNYTNPHIEYEKREITLSYGAKIGMDLPSDLYTNEVTLSVVSSPMKVATFGGITTMQALTPQVCALADENDTAYLEDIRDRVGGANGTVGTGTHYWVTKLADGNCWMSQNLDLNLDVDKPLKTTEGSASNYTPVVSTFGPSYPDRYSNTYGSNARSYHSWDDGEYVVIQPGMGNNGLLIGMTQALGGIAGFADLQTILQQAREQNISEENIASLEASGLLTHNGVVVDVSNASGANWRPSTDPNFTRASQYELIENDRTITLNKNSGWAVDFSNKVYDAHYLVGNYYQWLAATAQTEAEGASVEIGVPVESSICPANWQLPSSGTMNNERSGSFYSLLQNYGLASRPTSSTGYNISLAPLFFNRAGDTVAENQYLANVGATGYYWSSASSTVTHGFYLRFRATAVNPNVDRDRANGFSVRCLVLSPENQ